MSNLGTANPRGVPFGFLFNPSKTVGPVVYARSAPGLRAGCETHLFWPLWMHSKGDGFQRGTPNAEIHVGAPQKTGRPHDVCHCPLVLKGSGQCS